jgi:hypothetical protein
MSFARALALPLLGIAAILFVFGCSGDRSTGPGSTGGIMDGMYAALTAGDPVQVTGRVMTTDPITRMLTFLGLPDTAIAAADCEIVLLTDPPDGVPITFEEIQVGDSVLVCGIIDENNYIPAHKIRVYVLQDCDTYDVAFRETITAIDYAARTFTVTNCTETITVDDNTLIWGNKIVTRPGGDGISGPDTTRGLCLLRGNPFENSYHEVETVIYDFSDLQVGDVVEVRADIAEPGTLLALKIKVANCSFKRTVEFVGYVATIDVSTRVVTFQGLNWIAVVCPGALLTDMTGQPVTLDDFSVGDTVAVKGFPLDTDALQICEMQLLEYQ